MRNQPTILVSFLMIICITSLIFFSDDKFGSSLACEKLEEFKEKSIKGSVKSKYLDELNHNSKTINLNNQTLVLGVDTSTFFSYLIVGDQIIKRNDTDTVSVVREGSHKNFKLYFGCP